MNTLRQGEAVGASRNETTAGREAARTIVKVSVEVRSGAARFRAGVQAWSIRAALGMVERRSPRGEVSVVLPIEPRSFFVRDPAAQAGLRGLEQTGKEAA